MTCQLCFNKKATIVSLIFLERSFTDLLTFLKQGQMLMLTLTLRSNLSHLPVVLSTILMKARVNVKTTRLTSMKTTKISHLRLKRREVGQPNWDALTLLPLDMSRRHLTLILLQQLPWMASVKHKKGK